MPDIYDVNPFDNFMALIAGPSGCGKSIAINSWLKKGPIYNFDFDGRMASVANWYKSRGLKRGQLEFDTYGPTNLYDAVRKLEYFATVSCPYAAISIDSFTAVTVSVVSLSLKNRSSKGKGHQSFPTTSKGEMIIPDWDEWKAEATIVVQMIDYCKEIAKKGVAVFWTAHPVSKMKIEGKSYTKQTDYTAYGHISKSLLPIYFNEIYYLTTSLEIGASEPRRVCITKPQNDINAKTALNLPTEFDWTNQSFHDVLLDLAIKGQEEVDSQGGDEQTKEDKSNEFQPQQEQ